MTITNAIDLIVTDLDDTLWKWCQTWHAGYRAFNEVLYRNGIPADTALAVWESMYERVDGETIEFPPNPADIVKETRISSQDALNLYREALSAQREARDSSFELFDGVKDTLEYLKGSGIRIVAHTDSPITAAQYRLHKAGLDGAFLELYARPVFDDFGNSLDLLDTVVTHMSHWSPKPSTAVLDEIIRYYEVEPSRVAYVGDSIRRDMSMANAAGCVPVFASYGVTYPGRDEAVAELVRVQSRIPFPPDSSIVNDPKTNGHVHIESFDELTDVLSDLDDIRQERL